MDTKFKKWFQGVYSTQGSGHGLDKLPYHANNRLDKGTYADAGDCLFLRLNETLDADKAM